jgi:phosphoglycolate phosphatase
MKKYNYILFDLDGTLSESGPGIRLAIEKTCERLGVSGVDFSRYERYIGPPLLDTLRNMCGLPQELWDEAYDSYREIYNAEGKLLNKPYDGIREVLEKLRESGAKLAVCTSKLEATAVTVVDELGLGDCFDAVCGSNRDSTRKDKRDLIPYAVRALGGNTEDMSDVVMLGDTWYDAKGAEECSVDFIACRYGYGNNDDMELYHPVARVEKPEEILDILSG